MNRNALMPATVAAGCLLLTGLSGLFTIPSSAVAGEPDQKIGLWDGDPPGFQVVGQEERNTSTAESRRVAGEPVIRIGGVSEPEMHVYRPTGDSSSETAVVICPGGGFSILAWDLEGTEVAEWLQSIGVTAAVLKYRVPTREDDPRWSAPAKDAQRAIRKLRGMAEEQGWGIEHVGILGFSAGGQTAVRAAVAGTESYYQPVDDLDRDQSAQVDFAVLVYPAYLVDEAGALDPSLQADADTPPMFFAHAQDDRISCEGSIEMFRSLREAGVPSELHVYSSGGHGFGLRASEHPCSQWPPQCQAWMRSQGWLAKIE